MKIALVGHSYIKRMPKLFFSEAIVRKFCYGGAHASSFATSEQFQELQKFHPDVIFLQIGGNDIDKRSNPEIIAEDIFSLVSQWRSEGIPVLIGEIEHRTKPRGMSIREYDKQRRHLNFILQEEFGHRFVVFSFSMIHFLSQDGVHLSQQGNEKFLRDVRYHLRKYLYCS